MKKIPFNVPLVLNSEIDNINQVLKNGKFAGDGEFTKKCSLYLEKYTKSEKVLLTTSCTSALEMAAILINIKPGDEVIMPSFTFVSSANSFILRGAKVVFVDIRPDTMNIDESKIENAITERTKAIVPVHYAGVACDMDTIMNIATKHNLYVIEDAAQALASSYKGRSLGSIGHFGCFSFHETKNYQCGEGGALAINLDNKQLIERAEIIREKGTNRTQFLRGVIDKYRWVDIGSSYLMSELNAAFLNAQLNSLEEVKNKRMKLWNEYSKQLKELKKIEIPKIQAKTDHNGHIFFIKLKDIEERQRMINYLRDFGIQSVFHYIPLHESKSCNKYYLFHGKDEFTSKESERILRLPFYYDLSILDVKYICSKIEEFFNN